MMHFFKRSQEELTAEAIRILLQVKEHINVNSDVVWTSYQTATELRNDIDAFVLQLEQGNKAALKKIYIHFSPTCTFQEHSMANGWTTEYLALAEKFDAVYEQLNTY